MKLKTVIDNISGAIENKNRLLEMLKKEHEDYNLISQMLMVSINDLTDIRNDLLDVDEL